MHIRSYSNADWCGDLVGFLPIPLQIHDPEIDGWKLAVPHPQRLTDACLNTARFRIVGTFAGILGSVTVDDTFYSLIHTQRSESSPGSDIEPEAPGEPMKVSSFTTFYRSWKQEHPLAGTPPSFAPDTATPGFQLTIYNHLIVGESGGVLWSEDYEMFMIGLELAVNGGFVRDGPSGGFIFGGEAEAGDPESGTVSDLVVTFLGVEVPMIDDGDEPDEPLTGSLAIEIDEEWETPED